MIHIVTREEGDMVMIQEDQVFCVGCHLVVKKEKAGLVFRTGFYKCDMRLSLCSSCMDRGTQSEPICVADHADSYMAVEPL